MKAVFVDAEKREIRDVEYDGDWKTIAPMLGCRLFTCVRGLPGGDSLFIDDEGLLTATRNSVLFTTPWYPQPLLGSGLILNETEDGDAAPAVNDAEFYRQHVRFMGAEAAWLRERLKGSDWPSVAVYSFELPEVPVTEEGANDE